MDIILVRTAESQASTQEKIQGRTVDTSLTDLGKRQTQALAKHLGQAFSSMDAVYTSPLQRAQQTAQLLTQGLLIAAPQVDDRLTDMNYGLWEGLTLAEIKAQYPELYQQYSTGDELTQLPEGETFIQVLDRAFDFLEHVVTTQQYQRVIFVTHSIVIRILITKFFRRRLTDLWLFELDSASYSLIELSKSAQVISVSVTDHLQTIVPKD